MHKVLTQKAGEKIILLGNEAIVRGALEAGTGIATAYPGTPASEIGDTFAEIAKDAGIYFEYSTNEKVATEVAAGAAFSGVRSIVSYKHFGLNVASDSVFPLPYYSVKAGMVIAVSDDPQCLSSGQSEQDSRLYAKIAYMPLLEPSNAKECRDFTKYAFELSEKFSVPVFIRLTTRVAHGSGTIETGKIPVPKTKGFFEKGCRWRTMPPKIVEAHRELHEKFGQIHKTAEAAKINAIFNESGKADFGIITSGGAFNYVMEALEYAKLKIPVLKIGMTWPFPHERVGAFIKPLKKVLIVEELEPFIENMVMETAKQANNDAKIHGKDTFNVYGELKAEIVLEKIRNMLGMDNSDLQKQNERLQKIKIQRRPPILCPGCPHRATFWSAKAAGGKDAIFGGDIGCYILGIYEPIEAQDYIISMGAGAAISHGIKKVSNQKIISFIGDGTFFHAGIPPLINCVYNKSNPLIVVMDNRITAMTGQQPNPGMGKTAMGEPAKELKIDEIARACGVEKIKTVNPFNVKETTEAIKEFLDNDTVSMVISRQPCRLEFMRNARRAKIKVPVFEIDQEKCTKCGVCLYGYGCPAIHREGEKGKFYIDRDFCWGCSVCSQVCPVGAIHVAKEGK